MSSILYVATAAEIAAQEQLELQTKRSLENNATLVTEFIPLNYTTAQAAQTVITSMAKQNGGIMSPRGSITSDTCTNTLIVTDTEEKIPLIRNVINEIDIPNDRVLIEARIVEVSRTSGLELGFNYNINYDPYVNLGLSTFSNTAPKPGEQNPVVASTLNLAYTIAGGLQLEMEIRALENESLANLVSSPHLVVSNNETAFIKDGKDVPYQQATASGAASVAF